MKRKIKWIKILLLCLLFLVCVVIGLLVLFSKDKNINVEQKMKNLVGMTLEEVKEYVEETQLELEIEESYSNEYQASEVISQSIETNTPLKKKDHLKIIVSKGAIPIEVHRENKVNELGKVPIMMYHKIVNMKSIETKYTGGNVDKEGYNRTQEAFREDLEFYYQSGYRMIRLEDYIKGKIDTELGKSPIIITFDDGNEDNMKVLGKDDEGNLEIDPNCAVGILESFKEKYPDFHVTATFFVNEELFHQEEYNEQILTWLSNHGYDVGNHTMTHPDFTKINKEQAQKEVGGVYELLERYMKEKYVSIVALPYGSPYKLTHENYDVILKGNYNGLSYETKAALRVGWEAEKSPFDIDFNPHFLKRIRAYDNNGIDFDIKMNFRLLENSRYISDGDSSTVVINERDKNRLIDTSAYKVITISE